MEIVVDQIASRLFDALVTISRKSLLFKRSADQLKSTVEELLPIFEEIEKLGVKVPPPRQLQLERFFQTLKEGLELCEKVKESGRLNVYRNLMLSKKMDELTKRVSSFLIGPLWAHVLADVNHLRLEMAERPDGIEQRRMPMKFEDDDWRKEVVEEVRKEKERWVEGGFGNLVGMGIELGMEIVKEMVIKREDLGVVGISGIGGSGKTTLAEEVCRDVDVLNYFDNRILFLTVSQSPDVEQLSAGIRRFICGSDKMGSYDGIRQHLNPQFHRQTAARCLVVLDDVWSFSVLQRLIIEVPGYKTLVVSRFKFETVVHRWHTVQLLTEDESMLLFCQSAFGETTLPPGADLNLVKQIVNECKGLPLALKVIGTSLRDQPEMCWKSALNNLSRGEPICVPHESMLDRMAISIEYLHEKVKECFLDLGSFPEDREIPVEMIINMWVEIHDIDDEEQAFAILVELAKRSLLDLVQTRTADVGSCYGMLVTQHDVIRDLALHLGNRGNINGRKRLLMPKLDTKLPKEWERHVDQPFNAQIVSIRVGEMSEMDWFPMEFPKAEVLILLFSSEEFFLPPFIGNMPKLRALIIKGYGYSPATLHNFSVCSNLTNLRSLWLENVSILQLPEFTAPLKGMKKISLVWCKLNNSLDQPAMDLSQMFPYLLELTIDCCQDLNQVPTSICKMQSLECLNITNSLFELPADIGMLRSLQILRLRDCIHLRILPPSICELAGLRSLDIFGCTGLTCLPQGIGKLVRLEKIDLRDCVQIRDLPKSVSSLNSLLCVICDEERFPFWKDMVKSDVRFVV